jgi:hypothetical protein
VFKQKIKTTTYYLFLLVLLSTQHYAQVVINGAGFVNIKGGVAGSPAYLVLASPPATPIKTIGTTGGIMMETEYNITKYEIGAGTTSISVPYFSSNSGSGVQFPLNVTGISGGSTSTTTASLQFSSTNAVSSGSSAFGAGYDNVNYMPTTVNNMNGYNPPPTFIADNSLNAIDRFWVIDALGYSTSPAVTYDFGYITAEASANGGNTANLASFLEAQAFDQGALTWGNYGPVGVNTTGATEGDVGSVSVGAGLVGNVFRTWTLVNHLSPLPVDLLNFSGVCLNKGTNITWSTATETNSNYFTLEKSTNGETFTWLANVNAVGNSNQIKDYSYFDHTESSTTTYYRLSETDRNGNTKTFNIITVNDCNESGKENINVFSGNGNINLSVYSLSNQSVNITVYDVTGRLIYKDDLQATQGNNNYTINPTVANGIYVVEVETNTTSLTKRVPIIN